MAGSSSVQFDTSVVIFVKKKKKVAMTNRRHLDIESQIHLAVLHSDDTVTAEYTVTHHDSHCTQKYSFYLFNIK